MSGTIILLLLPCATATGKHELSSADTEDCVKKKIHMKVTECGSLLKLILLCRSMFSELLATNCYKNKLLKSVIFETYVHTYLSAYFCCSGHLLCKFYVLSYHVGEFNYVVQINKGCKCT